MLDNDPPHVRVISSDRILIVKPKARCLALLILMLGLTSQIPVVIYRSRKKHPPTDSMKAAFECAGIGVPQDEQAELKMASEMLDDWRARKRGAKHISHSPGRKHRFLSKNTAVEHAGIDAPPAKKKAKGAGGKRAGLGGQHQQQPAAVAVAAPVPGQIGFARWMAEMTPPVPGQIGFARWMAHWLILYRRKYLLRYRQLNK